MKRIFFFLFFLILSARVGAQPETWYFSFTMGGCLPVGSFAGNDPAKADAGFAKSGFALQLEATYPVSEHWGLKGMVMLNNNPVDRNGLGAMMESRMKKLVPFTEAERNNLTLTVDSWMSNSMVFGPVYSLNFDRFAWDFQAMAGLNVTYLPGQKLLFENSAANWEYLQRSTNNVHLSYDLLGGTALRMKATEKIHLKVALDYHYSRSRSDFEELKTTKQNSTITTVRLNSGSTLVPKAVVTGTVGFVYYL